MTSSLYAILHVIVAGAGSPVPYQLTCMENQLKSSVHTYIYIHKLHTNRCTGVETITMQVGGAHSEQTVFAYMTKPSQGTSNTASILRLTRRNKGKCDCIALDEVAQIIIHTLEDVSIPSSHTIHSSNGYGVFCPS